MRLVTRLATRWLCLSLGKVSFCVWTENGIYPSKPLWLHIDTDHVDLVRNDISEERIVSVIRMK
jgi:hypothetical protein